MSTSGLLLQGYLHSSVDYRVKRALLPWYEAADANSVPAIFETPWNGYTAGVDDDVSSERECALPRCIKRCICGRRRTRTTTRISYIRAIDSRARFDRAISLLPWGGCDVYIHVRVRDCIEAHRCWVIKHRRRFLMFYAINDIRDKVQTRDVSHWAHFLRIFFLRFPQPILSRFSRGNTRY